MKVKFDNVQRYIAIDPGASGGIAMMYNGVITLDKIPKDVNELDAVFDSVMENCIVYIESQNLRISDKDDGKFMNLESLVRNHERLKTVIALREFPCVDVHPMTWQKGLNLSKYDKEKYKDRKAYHKAVAQRRFPKQKVTLWNSDALLILLYGYHTLKKNDYIET